MREFLLILFLFSQTILSAQFSRQGKSVELIGSYQSVKPESNLGLENIFIFQNLKTAKFIYKTTPTSEVKFYRYSISLADKMPYPSVSVSSVQKGVFELSDLTDNEAIVVEDNNQFLCFWIIDYSLYQPSLNSISVAETEACEVVKLLLSLSNPPIYYRGVSGLQRELDRIYTLKYKNQIWSEENSSFEVQSIEQQLTNPGTEIILRSVPLMNTTFTITGDQYAQEFGNPIVFTSSEYKTIAVQGHILSEQKNNTTGVYEKKKILGGSAPVDIRFYGLGNKPISYFYTWFITDKNKPENPIARYSDQNISYTFSEFGNFEVLLEVANKESSCIDTLKVEVQVAESRLDIPNFMTPKDPQGRNRTFKVVSKSIIKYECTIFNRWGNKLFHTTNINHAWDGKYNGKYVDPGAYFYSIIAEGADGIKYRKGGDINVL